jgi:hypothetical protein
MRPLVRSLLLKKCLKEICLFTISKENEKWSLRLKTFCPIQFIQEE